MTLVLQLLHQLGKDATDSELLARFVQQGDDHSFALLVQRHGRLVLGICHRVLAHSQDAEDAFQAVFLLLAQKAARLQHPERLSAWLHGVAVRVSRKARSRRQRQIQQEQPSDLVKSPASEDSCPTELLRILDEHLHRLPDRYRLPLILHHLDGLTQVETARQLGCPTGTVAARLSRGRELLRQQLTRRLGTLSTGALLVALAQTGTTTAGVLLLSLGRLALQPEISPTVLSLVKGVTMSLFLERLHATVLTVVLILACLAGPGWWLVQATAGDSSLVSPSPSTTAAATPHVVHTPNFRVAAPTTRLAQLVANAAEQHRDNLANQWLGSPLPRWTAPCQITVHHSATGNSHAIFNFAGGKVLSREMELAGPLEQILGSLLPHQVMHAVLADHFGKAIPRWADEGIAQLAEDATSQDLYRASLLRRVRESGLPTSPREFLETRGYPARDLPGFYHQSHGLCEFLLTRKDRTALLAFVASGMNDGWGSALQQHYGFANFQAFESAWFAYLRKPTPGDDPARNELEKVLPRVQPQAGLADLSADGTRVRIRFLTKASQAQEGYLLYGAGHNLPRLLSQSSGVEVPLPGIVAQTAGGKSLTVAEIRQRLKQETVLLVHPEPARLPAAYLALLRPETLILSLQPTAGPKAIEERTPILPALVPNQPQPPVEPPSDAEVLRHLKGKNRPGTDILIVKELIVDQVDPPRFFPLIGRASLRHIQFKCILHYTDEQGAAKQEVVYIDRDRLHLAPEQK